MDVPWYRRGPEKSASSPCSSDAKTSPHVGDRVIRNRHNRQLLHQNHLNCIEYFYSIFLDSGTFNNTNSSCVAYILTDIPRNGKGELVQLVSKLFGTDVVSPD
jgi:hypothetical protein